MDKKDSQQPLTAQDCCVCGEKTKNRCSACGKAGTSLFFCSKEHQKLVWSTHKRVCGRPSFQQPLLTVEEADYAKEHCREPVMHFRDTGNHFSLVNFEEVLHGRSPEQVVEVINLLTLPELLHVGTAAELDKELVPIRLYSSLARDQSVGETSRIHLTDLFEQIARLHYQLILKVGETVFSETPPAWLSPFFHATLLFLTIIKQYKEAVIAEDETKDRFKPFVEHTLNSLKLVAKWKVLFESGPDVMMQVLNTFEYLFGVQL